MNGKVSKYVNNLFSDIPDSKQLRDLKEEVCANLMERISESMSNGVSEEEAFRKAAAELGDVSELATGMRKAANARLEESMFASKPLIKNMSLAMHRLGYFPVWYFGGRNGTAQNRTTFHDNF